MTLDQEPTEALGAQAEQPEQVFAAWLKEQRLRQHKKQGEIARLVGVAPSSISLWEQGRMVPSRWHWQRYAAALGISRKELAQRFPAHQRSISTDTPVTAEDLRYLLQVMEGLQQPLTVR